MNVWDEKDARDVDSNADGADGNMHSNNQNHHVVDDGMGPDNAFADAEYETIHEDQEDVVTKKKGMNPKIIVSVLALVTLSVFGLVGNNIYQKMRKPSAAHAAPITSGLDAENINTLTETQPGATIMGGAANPTPAGPSAALQDPVATLPQAQAVNGIDQVPPGSNSGVIQPQSGIPVTSANQAALGVVTTAMVQTTSPEVMNTTSAGNIPTQKIQKQIGALDNRVASLEASVNKLSEAVSQSQSQSSIVAANSAPATPVAASKVKARTKSTVHAKNSKNTAKGKGKKATSKSKDDASAEVTEKLPLQLRGVYPPTGEDRQAWVLDPATGAISVLTKGETIQGMRVLRVESDRVVTNKGIIQ